ncbi:hypothetical protein [Roseiflexus sp.]|uniref:TolB family protein n=1 Tax=Roseiflexus sp. TaxID=2562120 RepID=UPI0021DF28E7|nr:hypothetical protein [Roseiflexus sp.]GIW02985.1 MAG: hypothetical protein KatS3mg058_4388 [Roseiflexus sp.]
MFCIQLRAVCLLLAALVLMSACTGPSTTVSTTEPPTAVPSVAAPPTAAPAPTAPSAATEMPAPANAVLPAPLYVLDTGQIVRIERDGVTRKQITNEAPPAPDALAIVQFDVSPVDGTLVYLVQGIGTPPVLVRTDADGGNRATLLDSMPIAAPVIAPDGATMALRVFEDYERPGMYTPGLYLMPVAGGEPRLILADKPATDPSIEGGDGRGFEAVAWSPDGTKLLVHAFSLSVELCELAIVDVASGGIVYLAAPEPNLVAACTAAAWTLDSKAVYFSVTNPGKGFNEPGIWRGDAMSGAATSVPIEPSDALLHMPFFAIDRLYAFVSSAPGENPVSSPAADPAELMALSYTMSSVPLTGGAFAALRSDAHQLYQALWAPDGSGAVIFESSDPSAVRLLWLPTDGSPGVELYKGTDLYSVRWGKRSQKH